ncbi:hypothetical protein DFH09DRAFT_1309474 [Mycena vulgaris]|nr:hypothetical protein DFH09DRAFT_1309474 [Mycena vulgaris]
MPLIHRPDEFRPRLSSDAESHWGPARALAQAYRKTADVTPARLPNATTNVAAVNVTDASLPPIPFSPCHRTPHHRRAVARSPPLVSRIQYRYSPLFSILIALVPSIPGHAPTHPVRTAARLRHVHRRFHRRGDPLVFLSSARCSVAFAPARLPLLSPYLKRDFVNIIADPMYYFVTSAARVLKLVFTGCSQRIVGSSVHLVFLSPLLPPSLRVALFDSQRRRLTVYSLTAHASIAISYGYARYFRA